MLVKLKVYRLPEGVCFLKINAPGMVEAQQQAESQGYKVISAEKKILWSSRIGGRSRFSLVLFSQELLALLEAGLSLVETIDILTNKSKSAETKTVLAQLSRRLREGLSFSRALEANPDEFNPLYIAIVKTSERTGNLEESLRRFLGYHQQINLVRDKIISASVYPALLVSVGLLVILFLLSYVVPRFSRVFEDMGDNLPLMSRLLMYWGQFFNQHAGAILISALALLLMFAYGISRPSILSRIGRSLWRLPGIGEKLRLYQLARFTRTLAMLINAGIPFVTALEMVGGLLRQAAMRHDLQQATQIIRDGRSVSEAFSINSLATEVGVRLLVVGERSGKLGDSMERIATLYDDEIARWLDWFTKLFEPLLMIGIGLIIGIIVILMYLPIFELAGSLQ